MNNIKDCEGLGNNLLNLHINDNNESEGHSSIKEPTTPKRKDTPAIPKCEGPLKGKLLFQVMHMILYMMYPKKVSYRLKLMEVHLAFL